MIENPVYFWYEGLTRAVDFFTQKFSQDQLAEYSFEFMNEMLTLHGSALFIRAAGNGDFVMTQKRIYLQEQYTIPASDNLNRLAQLRGHVIRSQFDQYFPLETIEAFQIRIVIPLFIEDQLYGFLVSNGKTVGEMSDDDYFMAGTLMRLVSHSLENSHRLLELQRTAKLLDHKIFQLFAINQSSKSLLSELQLDPLYTLATELFSELTTSQVTSFGTVDTGEQIVRMRGYRNVYSRHKQYVELKLTDTSYNGPIVLHVERDRATIERLFDNPEQLDKLDALYLVLLKQDRIVGVVTLSDPIQTDGYDEAMFELVESLATSTYIAVTNCMLFEQLKREKELTQKKLALLSSLNKLTRNMNRCSTPEEIVYFALKTLQLSFGIEKAWIGFRENGADTETDLGLGTVRIAQSVGGAWNGMVVERSERWPDGDEPVVHFAEDGLSQYFDEVAVERFGASNVLVLCPLVGDSWSSLSIGGAAEAAPFGFLAVLGTQEPLNEEQLLLIDTVARNISPVLAQLTAATRLRSLYVEDPASKLRRLLDARSRARVEFGLSSDYLYAMRLRTSPFDEVAVPEAYAELEHVVADGVLFVFSYEPLGEPLKLIALDATEADVRQVMAEMKL
ncbi:GAF domain-containing protein [Paenibacillus koleovorans]|uniref:GAF domain-containing protein n=1 Tax=Paenibacillus koleovorans TaxID=121608 RepID=UPI000FD81F66|nr:GAF domain-containing protein [Paenibacillus koleovorans]